VPVAFFGIVFAATKAVTALVASAAHRVDAKLRARGTTGLMAVIPTVGLGTMAAVTGPLGAVLILTRGLLDGLWMPLLNIYMNRRVDSRLRATMLSLQNVAARLFLALVLAVLGVATTRLGLAGALAIVACVAAVAGMALVATAPAKVDPTGVR